MADPANTGIYEIVNLVNGERYIGSAANIRRRWQIHRWHLKRNSHHSYRLQRAWERYGDQSFALRIIETCATAALIAREQFFFDSLCPAYNVAKYARGGSEMSEQGRRNVAESNRRRRGYKMSAESRALISAAQMGNTATKGKKRSRSAVEKTAAAHCGLKRSEKTRKNISLALTGTRKSPRSAEHSAKQSLAQKGRKMSQAHFESLQRGRKAYVHTDEHRAKLAAKTKLQWETGVRSRTRSEEYRQKIAATLSGRKLSDQHRANVSAAMRGKKRGPYKRKPTIEITSA